MSDIDNKWIIQDNDILNFDLVIINKANPDSQKIKENNKTITIGKNEILSNFDEKLIGIDLSVEKDFEIDVNIEESTKIFSNDYSKGEYMFLFNVLNLQKHSTKEILETSINEEERDLKQKIKKLEKENDKLKEKVEKLILDKELSEQVFKIKAEEMAKNATEKVEKLKSEIKSKAKEEIEHKIKFANQKLLEEILNPINNLQLAIDSGVDSSNSSVAAYVKGFQMLTSQIFNILGQNGITIINPIIGELFNPELHHVQEVIEDQSYKKDQIVKIISKGYKLHERVIKPAIVIVSK